MDYNIRKAKRDDMPAVLELIKELADFEKQPEAVSIDVKVLEKEGFGEKPLFQCFVADVDGKVEGMALFYYRFSTWKGRTIHLEDLIIRKAKRGTGLGTALYKTVLQFAQVAGVKRVEWVVLDWNEHAIAFYRRSGAHVMKDWYTVQMDGQVIQEYLEKNR